MDNDFDLGASAEPIAVDALVTGLTFGLVAAPGSLGLSRSGMAGVEGVLAKGERAAMDGAPLWQEVLARILQSTPDFAAFVGEYCD